MEFTKEMKDDVEITRVVHSEKCKCGKKMAVQQVFNPELIIWHCPGCDAGRVVKERYKLNDPT